MGASGSLFGIGGAGTGLPTNLKNAFGPTDCGSRTFALVQSANKSLLTQAITLPTGFYKIQYDVACTIGYNATYQVYVTNLDFSNAPYLSGVKSASNAAFVTVTDYFAHVNTTQQSIYLYNDTAGYYVCYANVSIQDALPPAPTVAGDQTINQGATVRLTASSPYTTTPAAFSWSGPAGNFSGNDVSFPNADPSWSGTYTCTVTVNGVTSVAASTVVTVNALPTTSAITASSGSNGTLSPIGVTNVNSGGNQTYTITPASGYSIADVTVDGGSVGAVPSYNFTAVVAPHSISATFDPIPTTITVTQNDHGTISPGTTTPPYDTDQAFFITPATGYAVTTLTVDDIAVTPATSHTFTNVTATHSITATYSRLPTTITVTQTDNGTISPGTTTPTYGTDQTFSITPSTGYAVATLTVDGILVTPATSHSFTNVTAAHSITATYSLIPTTITVIQTDNGTISPGTTTPAYGTDQTSSITPATDYAVATLTVDGSAVTPATSHTFTNVTATHSITATFAPISTTITVIQTDHGTISPGTTTPTYGSDQEFNIEPDTGYVLATLTVDDRPEDLVTNYMFMNVTETHTITATFAPIPTTITVTQTDNGTLSPGTTTPTYGTDQEFSITPATGYAVATLTVDGILVTPATSHSFTNVTATHSITATFHTLYQAWLAANSKPNNEAGLKEYAFGTTSPGAVAVIDSTHITLGQTPSVQITGGVVSAVFGRRTNHEGLTYTVEFCDDLGTWYSSSDTDHLKYDGPVTDPVVIATHGDMDAVKVLFPISIKVGTDYVNVSKMFMRIAVSSN